MIVNEVVMKFTDIDIPQISIENLNKLNCSYSGQEVFNDAFFKVYITNLILYTYSPPENKSSVISKTMKNLGISKFPACIAIPIIKHWNFLSKPETSLETTTETFNKRRDDFFSGRNKNCKNCPAFQFFQVVKIYLECFTSYIEHISDDFNELDINCIFDQSSSKT